MTRSPVLCSQPGFLQIYIYFFPSFLIISGITVKAVSFSKDSSAFFALSSVFLQFSVFESEGFKHTLQLSLPVCLWACSLTPPLSLQKFSGRQSPLPSRRGVQLLPQVQSSKSSTARRQACYKELPFGFTETKNLGPLKQILLFLQPL